VERGVTLGTAKKVKEQGKAQISGTCTGKKEEKKKKNVNRRRSKNTAGEKSEIVHEPRLTPPRAR